jgi:hypothetical protein
VDTAHPTPIRYLSQRVPRNWRINWVMIQKIIKQLQDKFLQFLEIIALYDRSSFINHLLLPKKIIG